MTFSSPASLRALPFTWADMVGLTLVLAVGAVIYGWVASHAYTIMGFSDSMDYLFMADSYRATMVGGSPGAGTIFGTTRFPPAYPLLLAAIGAGSDQLHQARIVGSTLAALAAVPVWWWVRSDLNHRGYATAVAVLLLLYPAYFLLTLLPVSEPLGLALAASAFALLAAPDPTRIRLLAAALVIGLAPLARTALLPLVIAFLVWMAIGRPTDLRTRFLAMVAACAPVAAWTVYRWLQPGDSYVTSLSVEMISRQLGGWPDALWLQPQRLLFAMTDNWGVDNGWLLTLVSALLLILTMVGCALRLRKNAIDAWFLLGYLAMIMIWPYPLELGRFVVAVFPCLMVSSLHAGIALDTKWNAGRLTLPGTRPGALLVLLAAAIGSYPAVIQYTHRATLPVDDELLGDKREATFFRAPSDASAMLTAEIYARTRLLAVATAQQVPKGDCIYAFPPELVTLYSGVPAVLYPLGLADDPSEAKRLTRCNYFFLSGLEVSMLGMPAFYPKGALADWTEPVMVSSFESNHKLVTAAALLRRKVPLQPQYTPQ